MQNISCETCRWYEPCEKAIKIKKSVCKDWRPAESAARCGICDLASDAVCYAVPTREHAVSDDQPACALFLPKAYR